MDLNKLYEDLEALAADPMSRARLGARGSLRQIIERHFSEGAPGYIWGVKSDRWTENHLPATGDDTQGKELSEFTEETGRAFIRRSASWVGNYTLWRCSVGVNWKDLDNWEKVEVE